MIFVLAFDRHRGALNEYRIFADSARAEAQECYRNLLRDTMFLHNDHVEVNMFEAESEGIFRKTHSRYFQNAGEVMAELVEQLRKTLPN